MSRSDPERPSRRDILIRGGLTVGGMGLAPAAGAPHN